MKENTEDWDIVVTPKASVFRFNFPEIWRYRDLVTLLVKRDVVSQYKQTVLGPVWLIIQPLVSALFFTVIFGRFAKFNTGELPYPIFIFSGLTIWYFFSTTYSKTATVFLSNSAIFGKVYFPRLIVPISTFLSNSISFFIQFGVFVCLLVFYKFFKGFDIQMNYYLLPVFPLLVLMFGLMGMSVGLITSSLTNKYRDLSFLISYVIQFLMYFSSVVFPLDKLGSGGVIQTLINLNPLLHIVNMFRSIFFSTPMPDAHWLAYSAIMCVVSLFGSIAIFNSVEKSFMDSV